MIIFLLILIAAIFVFVICMGIRTGIAEAKRELNQKSANHNYRPSAPVTPEGLDSLYPPSHLSAGEIKLLKAVANHCGKRFVTQEDIKTHALYLIDKVFQSMDGWREWDSSIHSQPGQYDRYQRGVQEKMNLIAYDAKYKLAKVAGSSGIVYVTSHSYCSCPDFRARHLPCKHMYSLSISLEGHVEKSIYNTQQKPLAGLQIALAGNFGSRTAPNNIRSRINDYGGIWEDTISKETSFMICGSAPSEAKLQVARNYGVQILKECDSDTLFHPEGKELPDGTESIS